MLKPRKRKHIKKRILMLPHPVALGEYVKVVVRYDDLRRVKKPPAWMEKLLFSKDGSGNKRVG